jgi:hypothetical protein
LSPAACSIVLLCFCFALLFCSATALLYRSALLLLCSIKILCSTSSRFFHSTLLQLVLFFCSVFHLLCLSFSPIHIFNSFHSVYQLDFLLNSFSFLLLFLLFHSFSTQNHHFHTVSLVFFYTSCLDGSTSPLLRQEQRQLSKQLNRHLKR